MDTKFEQEQAEKRFKILTEMETYADIAKYLEDNGITGRPLPESCPVANYVRGESELTVGVTAEVTAISGKILCNTIPMAGFVTRFDMGQFEKLAMEE